MQECFSKMLYRSGWPTSVELLLLVIISQLALPLGCQPPLVLLHLLGIVRAARGLVSLGGVKVLKIRGWMTGATSASSESGGVWPSRTTRNSGFCWRGGMCQLGTGGSSRPGQQHLNSVNTHQSRDGIWQGREGKAVETHVCLQEAFPFQAGSYRS